MMQQVMHFWLTCFAEKRCCLSSQFLFDARQPEVRPSPFLYALTLTRIAKFIFSYKDNLPYSLNQTTAQ